MEITMPLNMFEKAAGLNFMGKEEEGVLEQGTP